MQSWRRPRVSSVKVTQRLSIGAGMLSVLAVALLVRFGHLQLLESDTYRILASDQHTIHAALTAKRGTIYLRDRGTGELRPVVEDHDEWQVYGLLRKIEQTSSTAVVLSEILNLPNDDLIAALSTTTTNYLILARDLSTSQVEALQKRRLPGIGIRRERVRWYPETGLGGQWLGFVSNNDKRERVGKYGIEGYFQEVLAGKPGAIITEKDAAGRRLSVSDADIQEAQEGNDIILTIDRVVQYRACRAAQQAVRQFQAKSASVLIMDPWTGAVRAMCGAPDFEPNLVGDIRSLKVLNNPITFYQYEPGSIFKPVTLAAGIDAGKITSDTTYNDTGAETIDDFTIRNSDKEAHGLQTMTQVLEKSLNTGTIFVQRLLGRELFRDYLQRFHFGEKTGIPLKSEVAGDISALDRKGKVFAATASFGQGISVTPLQMVQAFTALANGGNLMRPYLVEEIRHPDGTRELRRPESLGQVIKPRTSQLITAMLINVVERGHGKRAGVPGYYVAGKTGTAQIPNPNGKGYLENATIGSFIGYAPAEHPAFVMLVKVDEPQTVQYAESSAAPIFGELAKFLLSYYMVPLERTIVTRSTAIPTVTTSTSVD